MRFLFVHTLKSYLPEIDAYKAYLSEQYGIEAVDTKQAPDSKFADFDVVWQFTGFAQKLSGCFNVHEYNSLSTGRFPAAKNLIKKTVNGKSDYRVFLNSAVAQAFNFRDGVPYGLRDMGVAAPFFAQFKAVPKEYDLFYAGSLGKARGLDIVLNQLTASGSDLTILLVGEPEADLYKQYKDDPRVTFTGRVSQDQIPALAQRCYAALNFMPDQYPLNIQTSTKLLEYCALDMNIVSTRYMWSETFAQQRQARFMWIGQNCENLSRANLEIFDFKTPDVQDLRWHGVIAQSRVIEEVLSRL